MKHLTLLISTLLPIFSLISCGSSPIAPLDQSIEEASTVIKPVDVDTAIKQLEKDLTKEHNFKVSFYFVYDNYPYNYTAKNDALIDNNKAVINTYNPISLSGDNVPSEDISSLGYVYRDSIGAEIYDKVCYLIAGTSAPNPEYYAYLNKSFRNGLKDDVFYLDYFFVYVFDIPLLKAVNDNKTNFTFTNNILQLEGDIYYSDQNFNYGDGYIQNPKFMFDEDSNHLTQISFNYSGYMGYRGGKSPAEVTINIDQYGGISLDPFAAEILNEDTAPYIIEGDYIKSKDKTELVSFYPSDGNRYVRSIVVPNGVEILDNYLYADYKYINSITLPNSLKQIGYGAFDGCENLETINYQGTIEEWNTLMNTCSEYWNTFSGIKKVICIDGEINAIHFYYFRFTKINNNTEYRIDRLTEECRTTILEVPSSFNGLPVTELGYYSLSFTPSSVEKIIIPSSIKKLDMASLGDIRLESIEFKGTISEWEDVLSHSEEGWNLNSSIQQVICSDGIYYLSNH